MTKPPGNVFNVKAIKWFRMLIAVLLIPFLQACESYFYLDFAARNAIANHSWLEDIPHARVPFRLLNNHILIPVNINGNELEFVFDTGAGATAILKSHKTKNIEWNEGGASTVSDNTDNSSQMVFVHDLEITTGGLTLHGLSGLYLPDISRLGFKDLDGVYFDGILGQDHLSRFVIEIDYDSSELVFYEQQWFTENVKTSKASWQKTPLLLDGTEPFVDVTLKTRSGKNNTARVLLDTGSVGSLSLPNSTFKTLPIPKLRYETSSFGVGGEKISNESVIAGLTLGEHDLSEVVIRIPQSSDGSDVIEYGLLGNGILSRFNTLYDYENEVVYFKPNQRYQMAAAPDRSGLTIRPHQNGAIVSTSRANAKALGLQRFDVITSYDGKAINGESYNGFLHQLSSGADTIQLCWENELQSRCEALNLANRLM